MFLQETDEVDGREMGVANIQLSVQRAILTELKLLPAKLECCLKEAGKDGEMSDEWKLVAMVIDRLCFCIFSSFFVVATLITFRSQIF